MDARIKEALVDLGLSFVKGLKILIVYIIPSLFVAFLLSPELRSLIEENPSLAVYSPLINFGFITTASFIKRFLPEDSNVKKVL